jgi:DNA-directed RNA polymerase specialized sigma24 family protein
MSNLDSCTWEIAEVMDVPISTLMAGLARGRAQWREPLTRAHDREVEHAVQQ